MLPNGGYRVVNSAFLKNSDLMNSTTYDYRLILGSNDNQYMALVIKFWRVGSSEPHMGGFQAGKNRLSASGGDDLQGF